MEDGVVRQGSPSIPSKVEGSILARILAIKTASLPKLQKEYEVLFNGKKAP